MYSLNFKFFESTEVETQTEGINLIMRKMENNELSYEQVYYRLRDLLMETPVFTDDDYDDEELSF